MQPWESAPLAMDREHSSHPYSLSSPTVKALSPCLPGQFGRIDSVFSASSPCTPCATSSPPPVALTPSHSPELAPPPSPPVLLLLPPGLSSGADAAAAAAAASSSIRCSVLGHTCRCRRPVSDPLPSGTPSSTPSLCWCCCCCSCCCCVAAAAGGCKVRSSLALALAAQ